MVGELYFIRHTLHAQNVIVICTGQLISSLRMKLLKMPLSRYAIRCILYAWMWTVCYGFVLLSSAAAGAGTSDNQCYQPGGSWRYELLTTLLLNEAGPSGKDVGFQITAEVKVDSVWRNNAKPTDRLLKIEVC